MYPKDYVKKKILGRKGDRERNYYVANILGCVSFFLISILIAPLFHEFLHVVVLKVYGCYYHMDVEFKWIGGIYASLTPFCDLSVRNSVILLLIGVSANSLISLLLFLLSWYAGKIGKMPLSVFLIYNALGFFSDPLFHLFLTKGDIINVLGLLNRNDLIYTLPIIGFSSLSLITIYVYKHLDCILKDYRIIKAELNDVRSFLNEIR